MNWLDIVIIIGLLIALFSGFREGLIKILFTLAGGIIGVVLAGHYSDGLAAKLSFISDHNIAGIVAFIIIILATLIVATILGIIVKKVVHAVLLGWVDKLGGAVIGLLAGAIFIGAVLAMWLKYAESVDAIGGSALANFLLDKFGIVLGLLPSEFDVIHQFFEYY
jgi:membrane protein required for colicin V production